MPTSAVTRPLLKWKKLESEMYLGARSKKPEAKENNEWFIICIKDIWNTCRSYTDLLKTKQMHK